MYVDTEVVEMTGIDVDSKRKREVERKSRAGKREVSI